MEGPSRELSNLGGPESELAQGHVRHFPRFAASPNHHDLHLVQPMTQIKTTAQTP
jgi:hypothetical protein